MLGAGSAPATAGTATADKPTVAPTATANFVSLFISLLLLLGCVSTVLSGGKALRGSPKRKASRPGRDDGRSDVPTRLQGKNAAPRQPQRMPAAALEAGRPPVR